MINFCQRSPISLHTHTSTQMSKLYSINIPRIIDSLSKQIIQHKLNMRAYMKIRFLWTLHLQVCHLCASGSESFFPTLRIGVPGWSSKRTRDVDIRLWIENIKNYRTQASLSRTNLIKYELILKRYNTMNDKIFIRYWNLNFFARQ